MLPQNPQYQAQLLPQDLPAAVGILPLCQLPLCQKLLGLLSLLLLLPVLLLPGHPYHQQYHSYEVVELCCNGLDQADSAGRAASSQPRGAAVAGHVAALQHEMSELKSDLPAADAAAEVQLLVVPMGSPG
jgi:hypothetical protein